MSQHLMAMRLWKPKTKPLPSDPDRPLPFEEPRFNLLHPLAVLKVRGSDERRSLLGYAETVSRNGMMIGSIWPKEVGSRLRVEFALPAPVDLVARCHCEVRWARPHSVDPQRPGMGLEFLDLPAAVADAIDGLWRGGQAPEQPARRTWSDFDQAWIPWTPRSAQLKSLPS